MKVGIVDELKRIYARCPSCGKQGIGIDLDLMITRDLFHRTCRCGWSVEIVERKTKRARNTPRIGTCHAKDCDKPIKARLLCEKHYARLRRGSREWNGQKTGIKKSNG